MMESMAEESEAQVMVGSAMVAHPALKHNICIRPSSSNSMDDVVEFVVEEWLPEVGMLVGLWSGISPGGRGLFSI